MRASKLNFHGQRFNPEEWPLGVLDQMDARVISALFEVRNNLPVNCPLFPSPVYGAHVRKDQSSMSRHNIIDVVNNGTRLSDATDFFCKREFASMVWFEVLKHPAINGVGIYQNSLFKGSTDDYTMIHIDTRSRHDKAMWVALRDSPSDQFIYYSINNNRERFFKGLTETGIWE